MAVRDMLRSNRALRDEYDALKLRLAFLARDIEHYVKGKTAVLSRILALSRIRRRGRAEIEKFNKAR